MGVIDMFEYGGNSYRRQLKELYEELDNTNLPYEIGKENRMQFLAKMRGRFLQVSRLKRQTPVDEVLDYLRIPVPSLVEIENGKFDLDDRKYFLLITFLGCARELAVFMEKLEKAMIPGLRESRKKNEDLLRIYGYRFADSEEK